jgi:hypothetical protein
MHKKPVIFLGSLLVLTLVVVFGRDYVKSKVTTNNQAESASQPKNFPAHMSYWVMFHHIALLNKQADEAESRGEDGSKYRNRYQQFAILNDPEARILTSIALDTYRQVMDTDARAKAIVASVRSRYPGGKINPGDVPQVPEELAQLQTQRNEIIETGYKRLKEGFGDFAFSQFEKFVDSNIKGNFYSIDRNSLGVPQGGTPQLLNKAGRMQ